MTKGLIHLLVSNEYRIVAINQGHGSPKRVAQWVCLWAERLVVQWGDLAEHSCLPTRFSLRRNRPSPCPPALLQEAGKPRAHTGLRSLHTGPSGLAAIPLLIPTPPPTPSSRIERTISSQAFSSSFRPLPCFLQLQELAEGTSHSHLGKKKNS